MLTVDGWGSAAGVGVPAACGVSTSIASSLLAGVAVVDARPFFFGPIVVASGVAIPIEELRKREKVLPWCERQLYEGVQLVMVVWSLMW